MACLKTIQLLAGKLELENQDKLVSKAAEFERRLQNKSLAGSSITDTGKVVICLELAAMYYGVDLDLKTAIKYSGLKTPTYMQCRKIIENLLELNSGTLSIPNICLSLQCVGAQEMAETIFHDYKAGSILAGEWDLPQYVCMAVYQACRIKKIKVSKAKLTEKARLKPSQWSKLDIEWTKFVDENYAQPNKKASRTSKKILQEEDHNIENMEVDNEKTSSPEVQDQTESYDDWKKRILSAAHSELQALENQTKTTPKILESKPQLVKNTLLRNNVDVQTVSSGLNLTPPRRSPRKTLLKFSPYKTQDSPKKSNTVRLLFPL